MLISVSQFNVNFHIEKYTYRKCTLSTTYKTTSIHKQITLPYTTLLPYINYLISQLLGPYSTPTSVVRCIPVLVCSVIFNSVFGFYHCTTNIENLRSSLMNLFVRSTPQLPCAPGRSTHIAPM